MKLASRSGNASDKRDVLDIDATTKSLYGHQEGAEFGCDASKPGRPSRTRHTFWVGKLRLVADMQLSAGKQHSSVHEGDHLWQYAVMVADAPYSLKAIGQLYRDRADCEVTSRPLLRLGHCSILGQPPTWRSGRRLSPI